MEERGHLKRRGKRFLMASARLGSINLSTTRKPSS
jgi:hypothetical protein